MLGAGRVAGRGADADVFLADHVVVAQVLIRHIAPQILAHALVQVFGKRLGQAIGQGLQHDGRVIVVRILEALFVFLDAQARCHGEHADVILHARCLRRNEIGQALVRPLHAIDHGFDALLAHAVIRERHATARIVGVHLDIVVIDAVGRQQGHDAIGRQPAPVDELFQQGLAFRVHLGGRVAHHFIRQNGGEGAGQVPGLEERAPVDIVGQGGQVDIFKHAAADELRFHGRAGAVEGHDHLVGARLRQRQDGQRLLVGVLLADARVVEFDVLHIFVALFRCQQRLRHGHGTRGVRHVDHGAFVVVRDFHCRVGAAGGGAADQEGNLQHAEVFVALHFLGDIRHFFQ